jgi:peptidoglycan-N-acetylglucosamine deacetylase
MTTAPPSLEPSAAPVIAESAPVEAPVTDAPSHSLAARVAVFVAVTALIWAAYFWWRPPGPILFLKHVEHMGGSNRVSLTFDDAPHPLSTPLLLAALERADVKASFFVVGEGLRIYPELGYRMVTEGHALANHSENHRNLTRADVPVTEYDREIQTCFKRMEKLGQKSRLFRPPGGGMNRAVMQYLYENDITLAWWSNNIGDWSRPPAWKIVDQVNSGIEPGDIVLLHDAGIGTAQALPRIVRHARERGLEFVVMPEK